MGKRILLVEDDRVARDGLAKLLGGHGYDVRAVWSAEDGKAALSTFCPDVAILDVRLPGIPGDAFAIYLRHKCPEVKIIFISGEFAVEEKGRFGPEVDYLSKPLDLEKLLTVIQA